MTLGTLARLRAEGFGAGRREHYNPWIRVRRALSSPVSNQQVLRPPFIPRHLHLLSRLEGQFALLATYLGALEIREQFPTHAESDIHPAFDPEYRFPIPNSDRVLPGLLDIAREEGIDAGVYPGTEIPFVMTTDLVLTVKDGGVYKLVYWPVKPHGELDGRKGVRRLERLRLEQRRAADVEAFFQVMTDQTLSERFVTHLRAFKPTERDAESFDGTDTLLRFAETFNRCQGATLGQAWRESGAAVGCPAVLDARKAFDVALYRGLLDVSLSSVMDEHLPISWGGIATRLRLRKALLGVNE